MMVVEFPQIRWKMFETYFEKPSAMPVESDPNTKIIAEIKKLDGNSSY